jgi:hypothetical protein
MWESGDRVPVSAIRAECSFTRENRDIDLPYQHQYDINARKEDPRRHPLPGRRHECWKSSNQEADARKGI